MLFYFIFTVNIFHLNVFINFLSFFPRPLGLTISQVLVTYLSMGKLEEAEKVRRWGKFVDSIMTKYKIDSFTTS